MLVIGCLAACTSSVRAGAGYSSAGVGAEVGGTMGVITHRRSDTASFIVMNGGVGWTRDGFSKDFALGYDRQTEAHNDFQSWQTPARIVGVSVGLRREADAENRLAFAAHFALFRVSPNDPGSGRPCAPKDGGQFAGCVGYGVDLGAKVLVGQDDVTGLVALAFTFGGSTWLQ